MENKILERIKKILNKYSNNISVMEIVSAEDEELTEEGIILKNVYTLFSKYDKTTNKY